MCAPTQADLCKLINQKLKQIAELQAQVRELEAEVEILKDHALYDPAQRLMPRNLRERLP